MKHALVVGGSGMLARTSLWLGEEGYQVSIIGRNPNKLRRLTELNHRLHPVIVDYYHLNNLKDEVRKAVNTNGYFQLVIAWIHSDYERIIECIADVNHEIEQPWELYHVLGSSDNLEEIEVDHMNLHNCSYHQIQLGFILNNGKSRWLTHDEISSGVIEAVKNKHKRHIVGTISPWNMHP